MARKKSTTPARLNAALPAYLHDPEHFPVTHFDSKYATAKTLKTYTFKTLTKLLEDPPTAPSKLQLPWLKLAEFGEARTEHDSLRSDENMLRLSGVEGDYDGEVISVEEAAAALKVAGIAAILYTSPSHTAAKPRWRVLARFARTYEGSPDELRERRTALLRRVQGVLGGTCALSHESWTLSQSYFYGRIIATAEHYQCIRVDGAPIDTLEGLPELGDVSPTAQREPKVANGFDLGVDLIAHLKNLATMGPGMHDSQLSVSASLAGKGASSEAITAVLGVGMSMARPSEDAPLKERERWTERFNDIQRMARSAVEKYAPGAKEEAEQASVMDAAIARIRGWKARDPEALLVRPKVEWIVERLFQRGKTGLLVSAGNIGKTTLLIQLGVCMALGLPFFGFATVGGSTVLLSGEDDQEDLDGALAMVLPQIIEQFVAKAHGKRAQEKARSAALAAIAERVRLISLRGDVPAFVMKGPDGEFVMTDAADRLVSEAFVGIKDLRLVIPDTLRRFAQASSIEETAMTMLTMAAERIAEQHTDHPAVIYPHHGTKEGSRKGTTDMYAGTGSGALGDNSRFVLVAHELTLVEVKANYHLPPEVLAKYSGQTTVWAELTPTRGSLLVKKAPSMLLARLEDHGFERVLAAYKSTADKASEIDTKILARIGELGQGGAGATQREIFHGIKIARAKWGPTLATLKATGFVENDGKGGRGTKGAWRLTAKGEEAGRPSKVQRGAEGA
jgi:hypothetical protein